MFYEKKIKYLDYMVNGVRNGNAGFWKVEARDKLCNMMIQVNGLRQTDSMICLVCLIGGGLEREFGSLKLEKGRGNARALGEKLSNLGRTGIDYAHLEGIRIVISPEREIRATFREVIPGVEEKAQMWEAPDTNLRGKAMPDEGDSQGIKEMSTEIQSAAQTEKERAVEILEGVGNSVRYNALFDERENPEKDAECAVGRDGDREAEPEISLKAQEDMHIEQEPLRREDVEQEPDEIETMRTTLRGRRVSLRGSKWEQLWEIYPHITPFKDEREYLSISPGDFVVLPARYFRLANNSFLLHGYYNYQHLVLKRVEGRGEEKYYIGVPGTFFDREKQVAVMFGFESFECLEEPANTGDYGYYMMKIEL